MVPYILIKVNDSSDDFMDLYDININIIVNINIVWIGIVERWGMGCPKIRGTLL